MADESYPSIRFGEEVPVSRYRKLRLPIFAYTKPNYTDVANQEQAVKTFQRFSVDDCLALLWQIYKTFGGAITQENSTDTARYDALEALIPEVEQMLPEQQLQVMRDLILPLAPARSPLLHVSR